MNRDIQYARIYVRVLVRSRHICILLKPKESYTDMCRKLTFTCAFKSLGKLFLNSTRMVLLLKYDSY